MSCREKEENVLIELSFAQINSCRRGKLTLVFVCVLALQVIKKREGDEPQLPLGDPDVELGCPHGSREPPVLPASFPPKSRAQSAKGSHLARVLRLKNKQCDGVWSPARVGLGGAGMVEGSPGEEETL